jgi:hypothetical protein
MKSGVSRLGPLVSGIGFGLIVATMVIPQESRFAEAQLAMLVAGTGAVVVGFGLSIYNSLVFRRELKQPTIETKLESDENIIKIFPGGHRNARSSPCVGKWCLTNQRLIFEGSKPAAFDAKKERLSLPLESLISSEIVQAGRFGKYLEATFKKRFPDKDMYDKVQIASQNLESIKSMLEEAAHMKNEKP